MSEDKLGTCDYDRIGTTCHDGLHEKFVNCINWRESAQPSPTVTPLCCPHGIAIDSGFACAKCEQNGAARQPEGEPRPFSDFLDELKRLATDESAEPPSEPTAEEQLREGDLSLANTTTILGGGVQDHSRDAQIVGEAAAPAEGLGAERFARDEKWYSTTINQPQDVREFWFRFAEDFARQVRQEGEHWQHKYKFDGIVEIAVENSNVSSYVEHWESRTIDAELRAASLTAERDALQQALDMIGGPSRNVRAERAETALREAREKALDEAAAGLEQLVNLPPSQIGIYAIDGIRVAQRAILALKGEQK